MGAGAGSGVSKAVALSSPDELQATLSSLNEDEQAKVLTAMGVSPHVLASLHSSIDPEVIAARTATVTAQFHRIATETNGVKMVPLDAAAGLLLPLGLPHGRKTINLLKRFDADGDGHLDAEELDKFLAKMVADNLEASEAIKMTKKKKLKRTSGNFCKFEDVAKAPEGHDPTQLKESLAKVIAKHSKALEDLVCNGDAETANVHAILAKLGNDLLNPPPPRDDQSCECWLFEIVDRDGWKWTVGEYKKATPFGDCSTGRLPDMFAEALEKGTANLEAASAKWGPGFDKTMELYADQIMAWVPEVVDDKQINELEEPAIIAFAFGTGEKIGVGKETPTLVGPGCETPGLMNCGLAETIKNILAVRKMPVFAQWEIADALCFGENGCPEAMYESFLGWDFEDALPDGDVGVPNPYPRIGEYNGSPVYRALPIWPRAVEEGLVKQEDLADVANLKPYYLSTGGVLEQSYEIWAHGIGTKPKSFIVVGHPDHRMRCSQTTDQLALMNADGTSGPLGIEKIVIPSDKFYDDWTKYKCDKFAYDATSTQPWTTKRPFFLATEAALRNWLCLRGDYGPNPFQAAPKCTIAQAALILQLARKQMLSMLQPQDMPESDDDE